MLEKDSKSLYSVNGVLENPSSPKILSSEEDTWDQVIKEWDDWSKNKVGQLKVTASNRWQIYLVIYFNRSNQPPLGADQERDPGSPEGSPVAAAV